MSLLPWTIYLSFVGALAALAIGPRSPGAARWVALATALATWLIGGIAALGYDPKSGLVTLTDVSWIPFLGARYHLAADGISLALVVLTGLASTAGVLFSWNIEDRVGEFFALFLALVGGVYGVFLSADALLFFVFYEIAIVPKYFLVAAWGSTNREYGAMKLVLYSFAGSGLVMAGLLWAHAAGGGVSFALPDLISATRSVGAHDQIVIFGLVFFGFAVLAGLFPFHTWAPTGHVAAPTAASMLLAGVVMKLGAYGCLRVAMPLAPLGFEFWQPVIGWLAVVGIIYAGFIALVQDDFKFVIGYSSVSHMGFVMMGLAAATPKAVAGAVLQMVSHGVIAGLLFAVVGRMVYERTHTRQLAVLRTLPLHRLMPFAAGVFVIAALASMGMPGFSGFPAELTILTGTWTVSPLWALGGAIGVVVAAAFTLRALQLAFFGSVKQPVSTGHAHEHELTPISWPEKVGAFLLIASTLVIGLQPDLLLNWIVPSLQSPLMQAAWMGGAR